MYRSLSPRADERRPHREPSICCWSCSSTAQPARRRVHPSRMARFEQTEQAWDALNSELVACRRCPAWPPARRGSPHPAEGLPDWTMGRPVPGFGDPAARLLWWAWRRGAWFEPHRRMFTGTPRGISSTRPVPQRLCQPAGNYPAPGRAGAARRVHHGRARCVPPDNKPRRRRWLTAGRTCWRRWIYWSRCRGSGVGKIAFDNLVSIYRQRGWTAAPPGSGTGGGGLGPGRPWLLLRPPSRQNTQTGKLTVEIVRPHLAAGAPAVGRVRG
jgi:uracil-DNA glycosylase